MLPPPRSGLHPALAGHQVEKRKEDIMNIIRDVHFGNYSKIEFISQCGPKPARADLPPAPICRPRPRTRRCTTSLQPKPSML